MSVASSPSTFRLTAEQEAIIAHEPSETVVCPSFAGSGKTSTLVEYARRWSTYRGLYLAFNSDIGKDAKRKFPSNFEVRTVHSFAYRAMGVYDHQDHLQPGAIRRHQLQEAAAKALGQGNVPPFKVLLAISRAFRTFLISDAPRLLPEHLLLPDEMPGWGYDKAMRAATKIVEYLMAFREHRGPFNHDMYLKAFALAQQQSPVPPPADVVGLDESQDLSPVMIGIASRFGVPLIVVGDTYQSIYAFRGAVSAMEAFEGPRLPLTRSWRFGPAVAAAANQVLELTSKPPTSLVQPNPNVETTVHHGIADEGMILARTNARLMEYLADHLDQPFYIAKGFRRFRMEVEAAIALWNGQSSHESSPLPYKDRDELMAEAQDGADPVAARLVKLLEERGPLELTALLARLSHFARDTPREATLHLSTAHGAKGRERSTVTLLDDFWSLDRRVSYRDYLERKNRWTPIKARDFDQELNLLYVAITRAQQRLFLPVELYHELAPGHLSA